MMAPVSGLSPTAAKTPGWMTRPWPGPKRCAGASDQGRDCFIDTVSVLGLNNNIVLDSYK